MLFFGSMAFGQSKEFGITLENDLFTSTVNDKYYTNGIEVFYRYLNKTDNPKLAKKMSEFKIGQYIYNPQTVKAANLNVNDRPFAGYLFGHYGIGKFYTNESVLKLNGQLGVVGPNSYAEEVQKFIHNTFGYKSVEGWGYQINNAVAVQLGASYSHKLFPKSKSKNIDFHVKGDANVGTIFTGASVGFLSRIGLKELLPVYDSNLYGASINSNTDVWKTQSEFYFYINPMLNYQVYDATIEGRLFNDHSPVTFDLEPLRFNGEAGFKYRKNRLNLSYAFVYRGREAINNVIEGYFYGSISASWLLK